MRFFKQDRIPTTATTTTTKAITTMTTTVMVVVADVVAVMVVVVVADSDVGGTVVGVMVVVVVVVVVDGDVVDTAVAVMIVDDDVLVEHIDPDEPENMKDSCALKRIQAWPQSVRLKDVAHKNIYDIEVARDTSHSDRSALKDVAP